MCRLSHPYCAIHAVQSPPYCTVSPMLVSSLLYCVNLTVLSHLYFAISITLPHKDCPPILQCVMHAVLSTPTVLSHPYCVTL